MLWTLLVIVTVPLLLLAGLLIATPSLLSQRWRRFVQMAMFGAGAANILVGAAEFAANGVIPIAIISILVGLLLVVQARFVTADDSGS